jgi:hypothetical protein
MRKFPFSKISIYFLLFFSFPLIHNTYSQKTYPLINLEAGDIIYSGTWRDQTVIYFAPEALNTFDPKFDALKNKNTDPRVPNIFAFIKGKELAGVALPKIINKLLIPFKVVPNTSGTYYIKPVRLENFADSVSIYLIDTIAGNSYKLKADSYHTFNLTANDNSQRFYLRFSISPASGINTIPSNNLNIYAAEGSIYVKYMDQGSEKALLNVLDIHGRIVLNTELSSRTSCNYPIKETPGIYFTRILIGDKVYTKKLFID